MTATTKVQRAITETTYLGIGLLVAESEDGSYHPVTTVSTIREASEMAQHDMRRRTALLTSGSDSLCPVRYVVWAQGSEGAYAPVAEIDSI